jgi:hypothetical protein
MKTTNYILASLTILFIFSCGSDGNDMNEKEIRRKKSCFYTYNHSSSTLQWTAFKFTEKTGVTGSFNNLIIESTGGSDNPEKLLTQLRFKIPTGAVETQNEERNGKISGIFFKSLATDTIRGLVKQLNLNKGKAVIELQMNGIRKDVSGTCSFNNDVFGFKATIDLNAWNGSKAIKALNTACKDLHTGKDGKSVLWSTVDLSFTTLLLSDCN